MGALAPPQRRSVSQHAHSADRAGDAVRALGADEAGGVVAGLPTGRAGAGLVGGELVAAGGADDLEAGGADEDELGCQAVSRGAVARIEEPRHIVAGGVDAGQGVAHGPARCRARRNSGGVSFRFATEFANLNDVMGNRREVDGEIRRIANQN